MKLTAKDRTIDICIYTFIAIGAIIVIYPFYYVLVNSMNANLYYYTVYFWPKEISLENYRYFLVRPAMYTALLMSIARVGVAIPTGLLCDSMTAYVLRKKNIRIRGLILILATITMYFGGGVIPFYMIARMLRIYDTFWMYVLPQLFNFFHIIILMSVFNHEIPQDIEDSARIDGANDFIIYSKIFIPMSIPVLACLALFEGVGAWNDWATTIFFTRSAHLNTLAAVLLRIIREGEVEVVTRTGGVLLEDLDNARFRSIEGMRYATMMISTIPILMIYPFVQKYFVKGIKIGAIKG